MNPNLATTAALRAGLMTDRKMVSGVDETCDKARRRVAFELVVDEKSLPYLAGATIDFANTLQEQGFKIDNPNAGGTCACGDSFH